MQNFHKKNKCPIVIYGADTSEICKVSSGQKFQFPIALKYRAYKKNSPS